MLYALVIAACTATGTHCTTTAQVTNATSAQCIHAQFRLIATFQGQCMGQHLRAAQCALQPHGLRIAYPAN
jgi:hypothetical protein